MSDITQRQMDDLLASLRSVSGSLSKMTSAMNMGAGRLSASDQLKEDLKAQKENTEEVEKNSKSVKNASGIMDKFGGGVTNSEKALGAFGFVLGEVTKWGNEAIETYRELVNVGQTFHGSMIEMSRGAAQAGLPLKDFATAIKKNSNVVAQLGAMGKGSFGDLQKKLRQATEVSGLYGLSMESLTEFAGDYLEQQRLSGDLNKKNESRYVKTIQELALSAGIMSQITGEAQDAIRERTKLALQDELVTATMTQNTMSGMTSYNDALQKAVQQLAAQPGEAGDMLSKGLADTFSHFGMSYMTKLGQTFSEAGVVGGNQLLAEAANRLAAGGDATTVNIEFVNKMKTMLNDPAMLESLKLQAFAGNESAKSMLKLAREIKTYTAADVRRAEQDAKNKDMLTAIWGSFHSIFGQLQGDFIEGFLKPISDTFNDPRAIEAWQDTFKSLAPKLRDFGESFGVLMQQVFTKENVSNAVDFLVTFTKAAKVAGEATFAVTKTLLNFVTWVSEVTKPLDGIHKGLGGLATALTAFTVFILGPKVIGALGKGLLTGLMQRISLGRPNMQIQASTVILNGKGAVGGSGLDDFDFDGGEGKGKKGRKGRGRRGRGKLGKVAQIAEEEALEIAESGAGKSLLKSGGKSLAKGAMGLGGKFLKGAASGGLKGGLIGAAAMGAANIALDSLPDSRGKNTVSEMLNYGSLGATVGSLFGPVGTIIGGLGGAAVGAIIANWDIIKKKLGKAMGGLGKAIGGMWDWLKGGTWMKPLLDIMSWMNPIGLGIHLVKMIKNNAPKDDLGGRAIGDPDTGPSSPSPKSPSGGGGNFFSNLFAPKADGVRTPSNTTPSVRATPPVAPTTNAQAVANDELLKELRLLRESQDRQTAILGKLLKDGNSTSKQTLSAAQAAAS